MKVAIATNDDSLKSSFDQHFGRCKFFYLYDTEIKQGEFKENPGQHHEEKAGNEAAKSIIDEGIEIVIAGRFGSKVVEMLRSKNIQMVIPEKQQTVQEIINQLK